jgi:hypothetical protein
MKKRLLFIAVVLYVLTARIAAQCNFISPTVELNYITTTVPGFCDINFNLSFEISQNSGNKYTFIHLWRTADYQAWVSNPQYDAYSASQNKQPEFNNPGGETLNILQNALATIVLNNDNTPITFESIYGPDPDAAVKDPTTNPGITVVRQVSGTNYRYTISNVLVRIPTPPGPSGCNSALSFTGDAWSSQANSNNPPIHCQMLGWTYTINDVTATGFKNCSIPLKYSIGLSTTQTTAFDVYYDVYVDNGDGVFNAASDFLVVNDNGPHSISATQSYTGSGLSYDDPNSPYAQPAYKNNSLWYVITAPSVFSNIALYEASNSCATLPVSFKSFTAQRNATTVMLKWETGSELNNKGFAVERIINGSWQQIAFVVSQVPGGNSSSTLAYQFEDLNNEKAISHYRLRQVDLDGRTKYSDVRSVIGIDQGNKMVVFPNPSDDGKITIVFGEKQYSRDITVTDMTGRTIRQVRSVTSNAITVTDLAPGVYLLRVTTIETGSQSVQKVVIRNK